MHLHFLGSKRIILRPASTDLEQVKIERVGEKVSRIKDYLVGS